MWYTTTKAFESRPQGGHAVVAQNSVPFVQPLPPPTPARLPTPLASQVFDQVVVQPRDAREASDVFYRQVSRAALRYAALCCAVLSCVLLDASRPVWPAITP